MAEVSKKIAFAFDIDGVLIKGQEAIKGAKDTLKKIQEQNIPFIFLTNGGGLTEAAHVARLEQRFGLNLSAAQLVQSHSPFHNIVSQYRHKTILALGGHGNRTRDLAYSYGFQDVLTSSDYFVDYPHLHPFPEVTGKYHAKYGRPYETRAHSVYGGKLEDIRVAAIFVWSCSRDWCLDLQLIKDLLLSEGGKINTRSQLNGHQSLENCGYQRNGVKLYFCNPDFEWATKHCLPRFAQGAFITALKGVWAEETKGRAELKYSIVGKPTEATFKYAEKKLINYNRAITGGNAEIDTVYMIGDNPASDIAGANNFHSEKGLAWKSILVETGVHTKGAIPAHTPDHIAADVSQAVDWAFKTHGLREIDTEMGKKRRRKSIG